MGLGRRPKLFSSSSSSSSAAGASTSNHRYDRGNGTSAHPARMGRTPSITVPGMRRRARRKPGARRSNALPVRTDTPFPLVHTATTRFTLHPWMLRVSPRALTAGKPAESRMKWMYRLGEAAEDGVEVGVQASTSGPR